MKKYLLLIIIILITNQNLFGMFGSKNINSTQLDLVTTSELDKVLSLKKELSTGNLSLHLDCYKNGWKGGKLSLFNKSGILLGKIPNNLDQQPGESVQANDLRKETEGNSCYVWLVFNENVKAKASDATVEEISNKEHKRETAQRAKSSKQSSSMEGVD